jgi:class 3 adenylate cyclase
VVFDRRGMGLSDRVTETPTLEDRMDDVRAVMDAAGSEQAIIYGTSEGGPMALLFAATYPSRTRALILSGSFARLRSGPDYRLGHDAKLIEDFASYCESVWGTGEMTSIFEGEDSMRRSYWARLERNSVSPGGIASVIRMAGDIDVRAVLPSIDVPTLVIHSVEDVVVPIELGRYLASNIRDAKLVEFPGGHNQDDLARVDAVSDAIQEFVTGSPRGAATTRFLGTVMFSDIVGSTSEATRLSDPTWLHLLERHNTTIRNEVDRFGGRVAQYTGDGFFLLFDTPTPALRCAATMLRAVEPLGLSLRVGIHTGECERYADDIGGIAVHIGARIGALAVTDEVLVSSTVKDLVIGSGFRFASRGTHTLKGVPGEWNLFALDTPTIPQPST